MIERSWRVGVNWKANCLAHCCHWGNHSQSGISVRHAFIDFSRVSGIKLSRSDCLIVRWASTSPALVLPSRSSDWRNSLAECHFRKAANFGRENSAKDRRRICWVSSGNWGWAKMWKRNGRCEATSRELVNESVSRERRRRIPISFQIGCCVQGGRGGRRATDWKWLRLPQSQRESSPVTSLESSEDQALEETIENDLQDIAHLANVRADLRFDRQVRLVFFGTPRNQLVDNHRLAKALETFFESLTFNAQIERLGQRAEKIWHHWAKARIERPSV